MIKTAYDEIEYQSRPFRQAHPDRWEGPAFRRGYERGRALRERTRARDAELAAR